MRIFEQIKFLSLRHSVSLVSFIFSLAEHEYRQHLLRYCEETILVSRNKPTEINPSRSRLMQEYNTKEMHQALRHITTSSQFDVVVLEHIFMAQYYDLFRCPVVLEEHNIESSILRQCANLQPLTAISPSLLSHAESAFVDADTEWKKLALEEETYWSLISTKITVSPDDKSQLKRRCKFGTVTVIPNGVDISNTEMLPSTPDATQNTLIFMGTLDYYPNIDAVQYFILEIWPIIRLHHSSTHLIISGKNPAQSLNQYLTDPQIELVANPLSMPAVAERATATIVPLRLGSGTRIKILNSMAMGLPVISTSKGCEGLQVKHNQHLLVQDDPNGFAEAAITLMTDNSLREKLRREARQLVEHHYDYKRIFQRFEQLML